MQTRLRWAFGLAILATAALAAAGCGSSSSTTSSSGTGAATTGASGAAALGTPNKATGTPITVGLLNIESGPVTFPEYRQAAQAAADYINNYKGGIGGRPLKIASCATDGQPATSGRCATQVLDKKPLFILGGADTGAPGAFPVYQRAGLAYIGGVPFTPVESNAKNAATFISVAVADNAAAVAYAADTLGVKTASIMATDDTQGKFTGSIIQNTMKNAGIKSKYVPVAPDAADLSAPAASAISSNPDLVYVEVPGACPAALKALKSVGYSGKLMGIDPCTSPPALKAAGDAAEGLYFAQPFVSLDAGGQQAAVTMAALQKYAPADIALDSIALAGFGSVMNIQAKLSKENVNSLTSSQILPAFEKGSNNPNWLAHGYTCNRQQVPGQAAVCNGWQKIKQVKNGQVVTVTSDWVNGTKYYKPASQ